MIRQTSQSPPGKVPKTPPNLVKPWYTHQFVTQINNPENFSPPKTIQQINNQIPFNQVPVVLDNSPKLLQNGKQDHIKPILNQHKTIKYQIPQEIIQGNIQRKNNFIGKDIKQNQQQQEINQYIQTPIFKKKQIGEQQYSEIQRLPQKISLDQQNINNSQINKNSQVPNKLRMIDMQIAADKQSSNFTGCHSQDRLQTTNFITSQTPSLKIPQQVYSGIQPQSYIIPSSHQNQCHQQYCPFAVTNIKETTKDDCLFCKFQQRNQQKFSPLQSQIKSFGENKDYSQFKICEPIINPSVVVLKDHPVYISNQSHSLSPPHSTMQKQLFVTSQTKTIPSQFQKPLDLKETHFSMNPNTINRCSSAQSRVIDTKPISQPNIVITPSSPSNKYQTIATPVYNLSQSQAKQQYLQVVKNSNIINQASPIQSKNVQQNQFYQQKQLSQKSQLQYNNFPSSTNSDASPKSQQTFNQAIKQEFSNESDSVRSAFCQSPYFKEQQLPIQIIPGVDSFHQRNSLNSESILTQIHQQTHQPNYLNYVSLNSNISQNSVRSVKCSNSFNKTSNPPKMNETIYEPPQSKSSLLIQQLNRMVYEDNNNNYQNKQSNILSTAPITNQAQKERSPLGTVNIQNALTKQQHKPNSITNNFQNESNKYSQISIGNQIYTEINSKLNGQQSTLNKEKNNSQNNYNKNESSKQKLQTQENNILSYDDFKDMKSASPQKSGIQQDQLNFYSHQNKKIQDQLDSQNVLHNMRQSQIEQAYQQLLELKNKQKQFCNKEKLQNEEKFLNSNKQQIQENLFDEIRFQNQEKKDDQQKFKSDEKISDDDKNLLEISFNNNCNLKYTEYPNLYAIDDNQSVPQNKQIEKQGIKVTYPFTTDNIREGNQANSISKKCVDPNNYSLNDTPSIISEKKGDYYFTHNSLSPDHPKTDSENMILSDYTYKKKLDESSINNSNFSTTIKMVPNNIQKENLSNNSQRFMNAFESKVLENIDTALKSHQYEIASSSANSFNQS